jgi:hypothetical protein
MGYPIIEFIGYDINEKKKIIRWFPSEYLYPEDSGDKYCISGDKHQRVDEILFGGTMMRQYDYIFDVDNKKIGIARAICNQNPFMIKT